MVKKMEQAVHSCTTIWEDPGRYRPISIPDYKPKWWYSKLESNLKETIKCWMESLGNRARQWGFWKLERPRERHFLALSLMHPKCQLFTPFILSSLAAGCLQQASSQLLGSFGSNICGTFWPWPWFRKGARVQTSILTVRRPFPQPIHHSLPLYSAWYHMTYLRTGIFCPHSTFKSLWQLVKDSHFGLLLGPVISI